MDQRQARLRACIQEIEARGTRRGSIVWVEKSYQNWYIVIPMIFKIFQNGESLYIYKSFNDLQWVPKPLVLGWWPSPSNIWKWWELIRKHLDKFHRDHFPPSSHSKWWFSNLIPPNALNSGCIYVKQNRGDTIKSWHVHFLAQLVGFCRSRYFERFWRKTIYIYNLNRKGTWFVYPADHGMLQRSLFFCFRIMSEAKHPWRLHPSKHHLFLSVLYLGYQKHATIMYLQHSRISHMFWKTMKDLWGIISA